jgi:hypothetical protein
MNSTPPEVKSRERKFMVLRNIIGKDAFTSKANNEVLSVSKSCRLTM